MSLCGAVAVPRSLPLGGQIRAQNIEDRGEQRAGGVRWKHLLIWLILKLRHTICVSSSWIFKSKSETWWNTIWLPSKLLTPHHPYPPASRSPFCLFCEWMLSIIVFFFLSATGNLFRALQHHTGGLEKPLWLSKLSLSGQSFQTLQLTMDQEGIRLLLSAPWKSERGWNGSSRTCPFTPRFGTRLPDAFPPPSSPSLMVGAMGESLTAEEPDAALCLFSVVNSKNSSFLVLTLERDKQHWDLLQLLFTEGNFPWLPYIYVASSGFQFACYENTVLDDTACWRLGRVGGWVGTAACCHGAPTVTPQLSRLRSIYLPSCILYHLIKNVFKLICWSGCSVALATKFSHKY